MSLDARLPILLRQLHLPTVAANYARFAQEATQSGQRYEEYLLALLNDEISQRYINRRKRLIREARFPVLRTLDEFDFNVIPSLSKVKVMQLADGEYIQRSENIALVGGIGTGKTHVAISLGRCQWHNINDHLCRNRNELLWRKKIHIYGVKCIYYGYLPKRHNINWEDSHYDYFRGLGYDKTFA
jgi:DNA replication protein DnaC